MPYISDLPNGGAIQSTDLFVATRGNNTVTISGDKMANADLIDARLDALEGNSSVVPGTYTLPQITVNAQGRITYAATGTLTLPTRLSDLEDDLGVTLLTGTANTGVVAGDYTLPSLEVGYDGRIKAISNATVNLASLSDVEITKSAAIDGQAVFYDHASGKFKTKTFASGGSGSGGGSSTGTSSATFSKYRISVAQTRSKGGPGFSEIAFKDASGTQQTISSAVASRQEPGYEIEKSFDGNPATLFTSAETSYYPWYADFTFASAFAVNTIEITPRPDGYSNEIPTVFTVHGRNASDTGWTYITTATILNFAPGGTAKEVFKLDKTGGGSGGAIDANFLPPRASDFTDLSMQYTNPITTISDATAGLVLRVVPRAGDIPAAILKTVPTTGDWTVTARIRPNSIHQDYHSMGLALSGPGSFMSIMGVDIPGGSAKIQHNRYSKSTSGGYAAGTFSIPNYVGLEYIRVSYIESSNTYKVYVSSNNVGYRLIAEINPDSFGGKVDKIGLGFGTNYNGDAERFDEFSVPYWKQTW